MSWPAYNACPAGQSRSGYSVNVTGAADERRQPAGPELDRTTIPTGDPGSGTDQGQLQGLLRREGLGVLADAHRAGREAGADPDADVARAHADRFRWHPGAMSMSELGERARRADRWPSNGGERLLAGRYRVEQQLGRGGMAEVHLGTDPRLGRRSRSSC